jgi:hypothetical protein
MAIRNNYTFENISHVPSPFNKTIPEFFRAWDNSLPNDDQYLSFFTPEARLSFYRVLSKGRDAIRTLRSRLIHPDQGPVVKSEHTLRNLFSLIGDESSSRREFIVKGSNRYILRNGRTVDADFATYIGFIRHGDGTWQADLYEIFLDSLEIVDAIKEMNLDKKESAEREEII